MTSREIKQERVWLDAKSAERLNFYSTDFFETDSIEALVDKLRDAEAVLSLLYPTFIYFKLEVEMDYDSVDVNFTGFRNETDDEYQKRLEKARKLAERRALKAAEKLEKKAAQEAADRAKLRELMAKYPDEFNYD